jgi:hypothetical protein
VKTTERNCAPVDAVDCAPPGSETGGSGANASARAGAREDTRPAAQSSAQSEPENAVTMGDRFRGWLAQFSPPDIVTEDRPSLRKAWAYYKRGGWTVEDGAPRRAGMAFGWFVIVKKTLLYQIDWVTDRPATLTVATALFVLLDQFPPLSLLINVNTFPPLSWLI